MVRVFVKWGKERLEIDANPSDSPLQMKSQLFSLTGVNPERQKVLIKGKILGDICWDGCELQDGMTVMMVGSGGTVPAPPPPPDSHIEQTNTEIEAETSHAMDLPAGLKNLGNTCYLNATLQYFKVIPELREALNKYSESVRVVTNSLDHSSGAKAITAAVRDLYQMMDNQKSKSYRNVIPLIMLQVVHNVFPQFAIRDEHGWMQQDANECWTEFVRAFQTQLKVTDSSVSGNQSDSVVSRYMEGIFKIEMKNLESDIEPVSTTKEAFLQLSCFLNQEVKYVQLGIKSKLTEEITKNSCVLGRDARYEKKALIDRLPAYLSIQMVRFFYKEKDKVNAKILKDVKFPLILDLYEMCTSELQQKLLPARDAFKEEEDKNIEVLRASKTLDGATGISESSKNEENKEIVPYSFSDDPGSNNSGYYELQGVITHKGRSSNSGHYVAWVHLKNDHWAMCDDDEAFSSEDILKLSGGGDWHCAYVLLYGPRILKR
ncbi:unnamed protein product [Thelazia callipaeda]|uniref:Ubiquitin carboxyl-terminal hydrolase n=1 Tax=Thelazia callipaeda TaxID=103827 RepID=A0A158RAS4_THECL|nr:unnamed protein product [Thelazia callipaeda]